MASTRITDEDLTYIRKVRAIGEKQEDTLHRLLSQTRSPSATDGNQIDYARIERIVKNALESALAR